MPQIRPLIILPKAESKFDDAISQELRNYILELARILNKGLTFSDNFDVQTLSSSGGDTTVSGNLIVVGTIVGSNLSGTNTGDQTTIVGITGTKAEFDAAVTDGDFLFVGDIDLSGYVVGPASSTDNAIPRYDSTTGKIVKNTGITIDDSDKLITAGDVDITDGLLTVGTLTTDVPNSKFRVGVTDTDKKGLVVQMPDSTTESAFEVQDDTGRPVIKLETTGNSSLRINQTGTMQGANYAGFVLSVQNIGDSGEGSWIEILNQGGANKGAFFGMYGDQFQLFNWQGGDIEFWTHPNASDGRVRFTITDAGNYGFDGSNAYAWGHGWGGGVGVIGIGNVTTAPTTSLTTATALWSVLGELYIMTTNDTVKKIDTIGVVTLTDGATPALNAKLGSVFSLTAAGDRTIAVPSNPTSGQRIMIRHTASGADRTLALNSGTGGFAFGTTITGLTATTSGTTDYIECIYNSTANKWHIIGYNKGF